MSVQRVVVFGVNSFAGMCIARAALGGGHTVLGLSRSPRKPALYNPGMPEAGGAYTFLQRDINNDLAAVASELTEFNPDFVIDLAAQSMVAESWATPDDWYQTNVVAKSRLLEVIRRLPGLKKYIRVSTPEVYGDTPSPINETDIFRPSTPYAISQAAMDMHVNACVRQYGFPGVTTRFSNFYGPGQQLYRIIPRAIIFAKMGRKLQLQGGGHSVRAFIHGDDIGNAILTVMERGAIGETYHFSTSDFTTIRQLVEKIHHLVGVDFAAMTEETEDRPGKDARYLMLDDKAKDQLGWRQSVSLDEGLRQTVDWANTYWGDIQKESLVYVHKK